MNPFSRQNSAMQDSSAPAAWIGAGKRLSGLSCCLLAVYAMSELASLAGFSSDATYHISRYEIKGNTTLEPMPFGKTSVIKRR